jgi:hypothetical protein
MIANPTIVAIDRELYYTDGTRLIHPFEIAWWALKSFSDSANAATPTERQNIKHKTERQHISHKPNAK